MVLNDLKICNVTYLYFYYGLFKSPQPATFMRLNTGPGRRTSGQSNGGNKRQKSFDIVLTSELHPGAIGVVHLGKIAFGPSGERIPVAVKLAFSIKEKETLMHEYNIYTHLHSQGVRGIPWIFGLFIDDELVEGNQGPFALVMTFAGTSLSSQAEVPLSIKYVMVSMSSMYDSDYL